MELVAKWNRVCKLVSRHDIKHLKTHHVDDSLGLVPFVQESSRVLDVGSGGGFPGIPLALTLRSTQFVLLERSTLKCRFLDHVKMALNLNHVSVVTDDVRSYARREDELFDAITARAVADPLSIWNWSKNLLNPTGRVVLQTSHKFVGPLSDGQIDESQKVPRGYVTIVRRLST